jgi:hypothetical protein
MSNDSDLCVFCDHARRYHGFDGRCTRCKCFWFQAAINFMREILHWHR